MRSLRLSLVLLLLCGCASAPTPQPDTASPDQSGVADSKDKIEVVGIGAPNPILPSETQRKATARDAALAKARYELSAVVRSLVLQSGITLEGAAELDPTLLDRIIQEIADAETKTEFTPDDGCIMTLRLS